MARLRAAHLTQVLRLSPALMLANVLAVSLTFWVLWQGADWPLLGWAICLVVGSLLGLRGWWLARQRQRSQASIRAMHRATWHGVLMGLGWGAAPLLFFPGAPGPVQVMIAGLVTGILAAGGLVLATLPWASVAFVTAVCLGALGAMLRTGNAMFWPVCGLMVAYSCVVVAAAIAICRQSLELRRARSEQERQRQVVSLLLRDFEDNASDALWECDAKGHLVRRSARLESFFVDVGHRVDDVRFPHWFRLHAKDASALVATGAMGHWFRDMKVQIGEGEAARWWTLSARPIHGDGQRTVGWRGVISDVTESHRFEQQLRLQAEQDGLTGLANRRSLLQAAQAALAAGRKGWLMSIDLDHFKLINDTFGHTFGDEVLREVGLRLSAQTVPGDLAARLGGDEFAMLCICHGDQGPPMDRAQDLIDQLSTPVHVRGKRLHVGASVGLAPLDVTVHDLESLLVNADLALYDAKRAGRGRAVVYGPALGEASRRMSQIEVALRDGLRNGQFHLHFQPKAEALTLRTIGVEALMR
mgnify:FL=1